MLSGRRIKPIYCLGFRPEMFTTTTDEIRDRTKPKEAGGKSEPELKHTRPVMRTDNPRALYNTLSILAQIIQENIYVVKEVRNRSYKN